VSIQTTTGFCTADFEPWPLIAKAVLVLLMFIGGCAGSTAGGIKVIRVWIVFKVMLSELERAFRPNVVRPVRVGGTVVDSEMKLAALAYVLGIVVLFTIGAGLIMLCEQVFGTGTDFATAGSASVATLCTIGPGLADVGATDNYGWFSAPAKCVMCVLMALGRLEVFAIIVLFSPRFWRGG
jgi:trk system potassium uptake protein TrkH